MLGFTIGLVAEAAGSALAATVLRPFARSGWSAVRRWWRRAPVAPVEELQFVTYRLDDEPVEIPAEYALREFEPGEQVAYGEPYAVHYTRVLTSEICEDGVDRVRVAMDAGRQKWPAAMFRHVRDKERERLLTGIENFESCPRCIVKYGPWEDGSRWNNDPGPILCPHCNYLHSVWPEEER